MDEEKIELIDSKLYYHKSYPILVKPKLTVNLSGVISFNIASMHLFNIVRKSISYFLIAKEKDFFIIKRITKKNSKIKDAFIFRIRGYSCVCGRSNPISLKHKLWTAHYVKTYYELEEYKYGWYKLIKI